MPEPAADPGRPAAPGRARPGPEAAARRPRPARAGTSPDRRPEPPGGPGEAYRRRPWLSSYPPWVPHAVDVPAVPLPALLDDAAGRRPDRVALAFLGGELTYGELRRQVDSVAGALAGLGVGRGDRVDLVLPDCPQLVVTAFAALRLGAVVVPHDPATAAAELGRRLGESGATVAVCLDRDYPTLAGVRDRTALRHVVVTSLADYLPRRARLALRLPIARARRARADLTAVLPEGDRVRRFPDLVRHRPPLAGQTELDPGRDVALLAWTAGASGPARAAVLTHGALVANAHQVRAWLAPDVAGPEIVLAGLPLWHTHGLTLCLAVTVLGGGTLVLVPDRDPRAVLAAVDEYRPTVLPGLPALFRDVVEMPHVSRHDLSSVRVAVSVGSGLQPRVPEQFERLSGGRLVEAYGVAESGLTHAQPVQGPRRPGSVGLPLPGTRAALLDPDDPTHRVPVGAPGELAVTGPQLFVGYWRRPAETQAAATADGGHRTGNLAVMEEDGTFTVLERVQPDRRPAGPPGPADRRQRPASGALGRRPRPGSGPRPTPPARPMPGPGAAPTARPSPQQPGAGPLGERTPSPLPTPPQPGAPSERPPVAPRPPRRAAGPRAGGPARRPGRPGDAAPPGAGSPARAAGLSPAPDAEDAPAPAPAATGARRVPPRRGGAAPTRAAEGGRSPDDG